MNAQIHGEAAIAPCTPIAIAPARPTTASPISTPLGDPCAERPPVELVQGVRGDAHRQEERGGRLEPPPDPELWRERGADRDVREVPQGVRRVEQRPVVAPAAR